MKKIISLAPLLIFGYINAVEPNLDNQTIQLESVDSGYCMQLEQNNDKEGTKLIQSPCEDLSQQKFTFKKDGDYYTITLNNGKALNVAAQSESNGVNIVQNTTPSLFKIIAKNNGFSLQAKHSNKYISTTAYNTDIVQAGKDNQVNQIWTIYSNQTTYATCKEILDAGKSIGDGIYTINPDNSDSSLKVYCDMTNDGGGWTRIVGNVENLSMDNNYLNQFVSNPQDNKIAQWISNSDGSYSAPTNNCTDFSTLKIKESLIYKSTELRYNISGVAGKEYSNSCSGWGAIELTDSDGNDNFYFILDNAWGSYQIYGKNVTLSEAKNNKLYSNYSSGVQTTQLRDKLNIIFAHKGTPRHIFDISIR
jgi:hypothetical protein